MVYQDSSWQDFYERAWAERSKFMSECLQSGLNSYQVIKMLEKKERLYRLLLDTQADEMLWDKRKQEQGNTLSFAGVPILRMTSRASTDMIAPYHSSFHFYDMLVDIFDETGPYDSIVELGCGYGRNLFEIFYRGGACDVPYFGGEFTKSGVEMATKLAKATPNMNAKFFHFNHLEPNLDGFDFGKRAFIFTCHSIEQVKYMPLEWFKVVANSAEYVRCTHLEPFGFQDGRDDAISNRQREFFQRQNWNLNFVETMVEAIKERIITVDDTIVNIGLSHDPLNAGSLAFWHSNKNK